MNWHDRYLQQARWTSELRSYLFERCDLYRARQVLEVGCGTGAVLGDLPATSAAVHGLDLDSAALGECRRHAPSAILTLGNALALPFATGCFDITWCHYLLLWLADPLKALQEMKRVTTASGYVMAFAEPDYAARLDRPPNLVWLGQRQNEALEKQGAALRRGEELAPLFEQAGIRILEAGPIRQASAHSLTPDDWETEWQVLQADLSSDLPAKDLERLREQDRRAMLHGQRVLLIPTYFVWGQV